MLKEQPRKSEKYGLSKKSYSFSQSTFFKVKVPINNIFDKISTPFKHIQIPSNYSVKSFVVKN